MKTNGSVPNPEVHPRPGLSADQRRQLAESARVAGATPAGVKSFVEWSNERVIAASNIAAVLAGEAAVDQVQRGGGGLFRLLTGSRGAA